MGDPKNDFVEVEPGFFIERSKYNNLLVIGILPWKMREYLSNQVKVYKSVSQAKKPLKFQEKIREE